MNGHPRDAYKGEFMPAVAKPRIYAELIEIRAAPRAALVLLREGKHVHLIRAIRCDQPELAVLSPSDRARVAGAVNALREIGEARP